MKIGNKIIYDGLGNDRAGFFLGVRGVVVPYR